MESTKGAARREAILRAARDQFSRYGYAGASMSRIAAAAGVTKATLYYHFPAKTALFCETAKFIHANLQRLIVEQVDSIGDPLERLRGLVHAHLDLFFEKRDIIIPFYAMMFLPEDASAAMSDVFCDCDDPVRQALAACAQDGLLDEDRVDDVASLLIGGLHHAGIKWLQNQQSPRPDAAFGDRLLAMVLPRATLRLTAITRGEARRPGGAPGRRSAPRAGAGKLRRRARQFLIALLLPLAAAAADTGGGLAPIAAIAGAQTAIPLEACIREALDANAGLQAERQRMGELRGLMTQALATGLPTLDASGTWYRSRDPSFALDETFGGGDSGGASVLDSLFGGISFIPAPEDIPAQTYWRASLNAHWEISPGLVYNAVRAAGMGIERQELLLAEVENRTIEAVMSAYYGVITTGEYLAALDADLASRSEFLEVTRRRFSLGLSTGLDTLRAAVSLANLSPQRRRAAQRLRDAGTQLNVLMGRDALAPLSVRREIPVERNPLDPLEAAARVAARPDVRQIDILADMLRKNRGAQKAAHQPSLSADASYGYVTRELGELTDRGHDAWSASLTLKIPLFDGLLTKGKLQETSAAIRRTEREHEEALRQARFEIFSLLGDLEAAQANHDASLLNLTAAEDALEQMTLRYQLGKADYLSVLNTQTERFQARSNFIQARHEVLTTTASLKRALGYAPSQPLAVICKELNGIVAEGGR